jgi:hypothetical protein
MLLRVILLVATFFVAVRPSFPDWLGWSDSPSFQERAQGFFSFMDADDEDDGMAPLSVVLGSDHLICPEAPLVALGVSLDGPRPAEATGLRHRVFPDKLFRPPRT